MTNSCHDYVIKNGEFIGAFEEMYLNVEDPWSHGDATDIHYDMVLYLLNRYKICTKKEGEVLDIGCGKGVFTSRLKKNLHKNTRIVAVDIARTAIRKAKEKYAYSGIDFKVYDVTKGSIWSDLPFDGADLIVMSDLMWYVLPHFESICQRIASYLKNDGYLLINQTFYPKEKQKYGKEIVSSVEDMLNLIHLEVIEIIEINRLFSHHAITLLKKGKV